MNYMNYTYLFIFIVKLLKQYFLQNIIYVYVSLLKYKQVYCINGNHSKKLVANVPHIGGGNVNMWHDRMYVHCTIIAT